MIGGAILIRKCEQVTFFRVRKTKKKEIVDWSVKNGPSFFLLARFDAQKKVKCQFKKLQKYPVSIPRSRSGKTVIFGKSVVE